MDDAALLHLVDERGRTDRRAEPERWAELGERLRAELAGDRLAVRALSPSEPPEVLEQVVEGEGDHPIAGPEDLVRRLAPDRTILALTLAGAPERLLAFVEVAFTRGPASSIPLLLSGPVDRHPAAADTATFYSINTPHPGLTGLNLAATLLKGGLPLVARDHGVDQFVTLSPMPGFRPWWERSGDRPEAPAEDELVDGARRYLTEPADDGRLRDPVGNFHVANGAMVDRLCVGADPSPAGHARSFGLMVNYRYDPARLEERAMAYRRGEVAARTPLPAVHAGRDDATS